MKIFNIIITTKQTYSKQMEYFYQAGSIGKEAIMKGFVSHIIPELKELRKNTWDKNRVDFIIDWLENMCERENKS